MGQVLANFLAAPLASGVDDVAGWPYVAFDIDLSVVKASRKLGFPVLYGDASRPAVLQSAGISSPRAIMVMYTGKKRTMEAVQRLRLAFPAIPIYARAHDLAHLLALKKVGATDAILENAETSLQLGSKLLKGLGVMSDDVTFLSNLVRNSMEIQAQEALDKTGEQEIEVMKPFQVRVADLVGTRIPSPASEDSSLTVNQTVIDRVSRFQDKVDQSLKNGELDQSEDLYGEGVLYCDLERQSGSPISSGDAELETQNGSPTSSEDATEGKIGLDPSMPFVINNNDRP